MKYNLSLTDSQCYQLETLISPIQASHRKLHLSLYSGITSESRIFADLTDFADFVIVHLKCTFKMSELRFLSTILEYQYQILRKRRATERPEENVLPTSKLPCFQLSIPITDPKFVTLMLTLIKPLEKTTLYNYTSESITNEKRLKPSYYWIQAEFRKCPIFALIGRF